MKFSIIGLLFAFSYISCSAKDRNNTLDGGLGRGQHFPYVLLAWKGKEQVITKLEKADVVYEFVRVSKEEFQVRKAGDGGEVFFRFNTEFPDGGAIWLNGRLVDIIQSEEKISALLYGDSGYFLIESSRAKPKIKKGQIYLMPKPVRTHNWNRTFLAMSRDYYQNIDDVRYPLSNKIASAKLIDFRKIEFVYSAPNGAIEAPDLFHYEGCSLFKNGKIHVKNALVTECIVSEKAHLAGLETALQDKDKRATKLKYYDKEDLLVAFSNASDPEIYRKLVDLVEKLYAPANK